MSRAETADLSASDGLAHDVLGYSISATPSTVVVGAEGATVGSQENQGASYVFVKAKNGWADTTERAKLTGSDGTVNAYFGNSVSISGNTVVVGAPFQLIVGVGNAGAGYVYTKPKKGWTTTSTYSAQLYAPNSADPEDGWGVSISGSTILLGAPNTTVGNDQQGAAYIFGQ